MLLHLAQSNLSLFQMVSERRTVAMKLGWPKELLEVEAKHRENWVTSYRSEISNVVLITYLPLSHTQCLTLGDLLTPPPPVCISLALTCSRNIA